LLANVDPIPLLNGKVSSGGRLNVNNAIRACMPNFSLSATPAAQSDSNRTGASYTVTVTPSGGFAGVVNFSVNGLPPAASSSCTPTPASGAGSPQMAVTAGASTPTGVYPLTITGTSGARVNTASVTLTISSAPTTLSVASNSNPSVYGGAVTL